MYPIPSLTFDLFKVDYTQTNICTHGADLTNWFWNTKNLWDGEIWQSDIDNKDKDVLQHMCDPLLSPWGRGRVGIHMSYTFTPVMTDADIFVELSTIKEKKNQKPSISYGTRFS